MSSTDPTVTPVAQRPRRIPFHLRKQASDKLAELQNLDIIEPAEGMGITYRSSPQTTQFRGNQIMWRLPSSKSGAIKGKTSDPNRR